RRNAAGRAVGARAAAAAHLGSSPGRQRPPAAGTGHGPDGTAAASLKTAYRPAERPPSGGRSFYVCVQRSRAVVIQIKGLGGSSAHTSPLTFKECARCQYPQRFGAAATTPVRHC